MSLAIDNSPDSMADNESENKMNLPRKRSKVSRACDACRRKKVRCDAEFLCTLNLVTKICTNCFKARDTCTFSRIPLKRGPIKGYAKENDKGLDSDSVRSRLGLDAYALQSQAGIAAAVSNGYIPPIQSSVGTNGSTNSYPLAHRIYATPSNTSDGSNNSNGSEVSATSSSISTIGPPVSLKHTASTAISLKQATSSTAPLNHTASSNIRGTSPPSPAQQTLAKPLLHRLKFSPSTPTLPIILPPLIGPQGLTQPVTLAVPISNANRPVSPNTGNPPSSADTKDPRPLWKVPYEMPSVHSGLEGSHASMGFHSRRSSVESVSSILTAGSRSRLPSLQPLSSVNSDNNMTDSDNDDMYSARSRASLSPRNSITSLLSLNGRMGKLLRISDGNSHLPGPQTAPGFAIPTLFNLAPSQTAYPMTQQSPFQASGFTSAPPTGMQTNGFPYSSHFTPLGVHPTHFNGASPLNALDFNIRLYYSRFHNNFPILPFNEKTLHRQISTLLQSPQTGAIVQYFSSALSNLINYQVVSLEALVSLLRHFLSIYPFSLYGIPASDDVLLLSLASMLLVNYTIFIKGDVYSLAIAVTTGVLNDFKISESFLALCTKHDGLTSLDCDDIQLYLPRLYLCLQIIDNSYSLGYGTRPQTSGNLKLFLESLPTSFPKSFQDQPFIANLLLASFFHQLLEARGQREFKRSAIFSTIPGSLQKTDFPLLLVIVLKDKYELSDTLVEISNHFNNNSGNVEETREIIYDSQVKTSRLVRKLTQSILSLANYVSSIYFQAKSPISEGLDLNNPFFNLGFGQSVKYIFICKQIVDLILSQLRDSEIIARLVKTNNDLSIAFNLLVSIINNNMSSMGNPRNQFSSPGVGGTGSNTVESSDGCGLGSSSLQLISKKLETYKLTFNNLPINSEETSAQENQKSMIKWKSDFSLLVDSLIGNEDTDGWY